METPGAPHPTPRWAPWALIAITLAAAAFRLPGLTAEEPWFDEVFSIVVASQDLKELWRRVVADQTNPPGFYLLLWGWTRLGSFDLAWMRALPFLASVLTVPAMAVASRAVGLGWSGTMVAASLAAASPLMFAMASELRAYAPLALASALALGAAARRRTLLSALLGVVLVLLHYFGTFVVAALALAALREDRTRWRTALGTVLPAALALGVWVLVVVRAAGDGAVGGNAGWIAPPGARGLLSFGSQAVGTFGTVWGALVVAAALAVALAVAVRTRRARCALEVAVVPLVLVAAATLATGRELWVARYLIITLPGWWLLLALAVERTPGRWQEAALAALLTWSSLAGIHAERTRPRKTSWSLVARALTAGGPRTICTNESYVALPLRFAAAGQRIPLTVLDLSECVAARAPRAMLLRLGTEESVEALHARGALAGPARDLGTSLPRTALVPLTWPRP